MMPATAVTAVSAADKQRQVESLLAGLFKHMEYPARLEFKDMPDGGLGVAVYFDAELPGITGHKRTYLVDCIQFLVNKVVNRPNVEKRWVTLGVNAFPEPRGLKPEPSASALAASAPRPAASKKAPAPAPPPMTNGKKAHESKPAPPAPSHPSHRRSSEPDEKSLAPEPNVDMTRLGATLAEKAAKFGRLYAVTLLGAEDRARVMAAAAKVKGVTSRAEGEGYFRRVLFVPEKPVVIVKRQVMPDYDDEE